MLINDILDLTKIESGTVVVDVGEVRLDDLHSYVERTFRHVAENKAVEFHIHVAPDMPQSIFTDAKRLQQVLKNLLSNAFKFTHHGQVALTLEPARSGWSFDHEELNRAPTVLALSVTDTGIGISSDKQQIIFEAFQQADGSTSRKYGGTGLGLAISRELSRLLGGEIRLKSNPGTGSTFTLYLPQIYMPPRSPRKATIDAPPNVAPVTAPVNGDSRTNGTTATQFENGTMEVEAPRLVNVVGDDRDLIRLGDRVLLIVENDLGFARLLLETAREKGFKGIVTSFGAAALAMTREYKPSAVTLDIYLPDIEGWRVLERLKRDVQTRHIAVCVISTDESRERALNSGALAFVAKPIKTKEVVDELVQYLKDFTDRPERHLLVVEGNATRRDQILKCLEPVEAEVTTMADGAEALARIRDNGVDCLVLDPQLPEQHFSEFTDELRTPIARQLPVIVFGDGTQPLEQAGFWNKISHACTVRHVQSAERLLDQAALFLHRDVSKLPDSKRRLLESLHSSDQVLPGKKVLIVDDDMRNIFALSTVLEDHDMVIVSADNGRDAIRILQEQSDVEIVLMDIMMPELDGIDTMREIRKVPALKALPIIAVTAKAMKGDREKCIEAGAWDYLSKPVDTEQMLAVLRSWLHR
jgi:CheY-like chemotaxis protein